MTQTDKLLEALEKHYPEGMWKQPSGNTVLVCECGEKLWGVNRGACQAAWRLHVEQALATLSKPEPAATAATPADARAIIEACAKVAENFEGTASMERCDDPLSAAGYAIGDLIRSKAPEIIAALQSKGATQ